MCSNRVNRPTYSLQLTSTTRKFLMYPCSRAPIGEGARLHLAITDIDSDKTA